MMQRSSTITNSNDPEALRRRVFIGNLNTLGLTKQDIEGIFLRYGPVTGVSIHKGYAFVQFINEMDGRRCASAEDGAVYGGQRIDVNMAAEPKTKNVKAQMNIKPTPLMPGFSDNSFNSYGSGNQRSTDFDSFNSYGSADQSFQAPRMQKRPLQMGRGRPMSNPSAPKHMRSDAPQTSGANRNLVTLSAQTPVSRVRAGQSGAAASVNPTPYSSSSTTVSTVTNKAQSDILVCGLCRRQFANLSSLAQHKKVKCEPASCSKCEGESEPCQLQCASCEESFTSAWELCKHCQEEHSIQIYRLENENGEEVQNGQDT